jgi:hypothetical protein
MLGCLNGLARTFEISTEKEDLQIILPIVLIQSLANTTLPYRCKPSIVKSPNSNAEGLIVFSHTKSGPKSYKNYGHILCVTCTGLNYFRK